MDFFRTGHIDGSLNVCLITAAKMKAKLSFWTTQLVVSVTIQIMLYHIF